MRIPKAVRDLQAELNAEVYLVGGAVRDLLRGQEPKDLDFVVRKVDPKQFEDFLAARGNLQLVGKSFGIYLFRPEGSPDTVELAFPRTEVSTGDGHTDFEVVTNPDISIEEDSKRRDFTLNSLYLPITAVSGTGSFRDGDVFDYHGGMDHIVERLIVGVGDPNQRIEEDPLRMLRAAVLVARTGFRLEGRTFAAVKRNARKINSISAERVRDEFIKLMESDVPSRGLKMMRRTHLLKEVLPELDACYGCGQNPKYHSYPVFEHLLAAADAACQITPRLDVRLGTLFHDLGKAPTRALREGADNEDDVTFHNHELVSTQMAFQIMCRLKFPRAFTEDVVRLVRQHQYKYAREWKDQAVRRFIKAAGIVEADLTDLDNHPQFLLRQADRMGNALKAHLPITQKQRDFQRRIIEVFNASTAHTPRDLKVNGSVLMEELGMQEGPLLGETIRHLFNLVEEDPSLNDKEKLLAAAKSFTEEK